MIKPCRRHVNNKCVLISLIILISLGGIQNTIAQAIFNTQLETLDDKTFELSDWKNNKFTVVLFLLADCPACQSYSLTLNNLAKQFSSCGVKFYGVFPGHYGTTQEDMEFKKTYKISFPLLRDPEKKITSLLHAKVAPEAFLIDRNGKVLYRGRIDDWMYAVGKKRIKINSKDLQNAISESCEGKAVSKPATQAIGCIIE